MTNFTQGIHKIHDSDAEPIKMTRFEIFDAKLRDVLLTEPLRSMLTPIQLANVHRLRGFVVGMKIMKSTSDYLEQTWREAKKLLKAERHIDVPSPVELRNHKRINSPSSVQGQRNHLESQP